MSARDCDAAFAERQVVTTVVASRHAAAHLEGLVSADDFGSLLNRRLFVAGIERDLQESTDERLAALSRASGWSEDDLRALLDAPDRLCGIDASRFAIRVRECAEARRLAERLALAHARLHETGSIEPVVAELRQIVGTAV